MLGRFLQRDPIGYDAEDVNLIRYVLNLPINAIDSQGKKLCQKFPPSPNGCGPKGGTKFPENFGTWNFGPACNAHDICYGTCGSNKADCDRKFRDNMYKQCDTYYSWINPAAIDIYHKCRNIAYIYYKAVKLYGQKAFDNAQKENCIEVPKDECCPST
jgi:hypothetical protein